MMKVAVIGATGLVGQTICKVLQGRDFPVDEMIPVASGKSVNKTFSFGKKEYNLVDIESAYKKKPDMALFSAGNKISEEWCPRFSETGVKVIDNSSAWRMDSNVKLIVPEVNGAILSKKDLLIANPNCSTIQMVMVLAPLHTKYKIKRIVVSTYQSVSGTGSKAVEQLDNERTGVISERAYPHNIDLNCLPHAGEFSENAYTTEEIKIVQETRKILNDESIKITATAVRVPVIGGHSEAVNIEFAHAYDLSEVHKLLTAFPGVTIEDDPELNIYPMPFFAKGKDEVYVGRIRRDESQPNSLNLWIVSDNLRKGAATNTVQIAEHLVEKGWLS